MPNPYYEEPGGIIIEMYKAADSQAAQFYPPVEEPVAEPDPLFPGLETPLFP